MTDDKPPPGSFADHPPTIGEIRSNKSGLGNDWTPRDLLVSLLRELDSGQINPDTLLVVFREPFEDGFRTGFRVSAPDPSVALGMFEIGKLKFLGLL